MTREEWLEQAIEKLKPMYKTLAQVDVPPVRVSVGFTTNRGNKLNTLGACWNAKASSDNRPQIFIVPTLDDASRVLDVLAHELIHAIVPDAKHGKPFKRIAQAIGLTGKMTATVAGPDLIPRLNSVIEQIGPYPHAKLNPALSGIKKQTTRLIKVHCEPCEYIARVSHTTLDTLGAPICPSCNESMAISM